MRKLKESVSDEGSRADDLNISHSCPDVCKPWMRVIRSAVAFEWDGLFRQGLLRPWRVDSACTQLGTCIMSMRNLGIPLSNDIWASERKDFARDFLASNTPENSRMWGTMGAHELRRGMCYKSGSFVDVPSRGPRDILVCGPPCQPYSLARDHGKDPELLGCEAHTLYGDTFGGDVGGKRKTDEGSFIEMVEANPPLMIVFENTIGFGIADPKASRVPLHGLVSRLQAIQVDGEQFYKAIHVFNLDSKSWVDMSRPRFVDAY